MKPEPCSKCGGEWTTTHEGYDPATRQVTFTMSHECKPLDQEGYWCNQCRAWWPVPPPDEDGGQMCPIWNVHDVRELKRPRQRVFVCSPYRAYPGSTVEDNVHLAEKVCRHLTLQGFAPFAPHLLYTRFMIDGDPSERDGSIAAGCSHLLVSDWIYVAHTPRGISEGMKEEIDFASKYGIPTLHEVSK